MSSNPIDVDDRMAERCEYLTFFVRGEEYAVGLRRVREVIAFNKITRIPHMPPALRGVTGFRGEVVPVLDLAIKFHGIETAVDPKLCASLMLVETVIDGRPRVLGLITEAVGQVLALTDADVVPPPSFGAPIRTEFLAGRGRVGTKFALLLDIDRLLTFDELLSAQLAEPLAVTDAAV
ncbi:MAG TPA: chemotaxis protein CheW [Kofleriaceae bacterium]|nr:chemotaxis protein CheW [Kofleriaceae bacterium]